jgi:hypothetical protein
VQHGAAVAKRPGARIPWRLLAHEPVFDHQAVVRERILIEEVSELAVESLVLVVANLEQPSSTRKVLPKLSPRSCLAIFGVQPFQVLAIEEHDPVFLVRVRVRYGRESAPVPGTQEV